MATSINRNSTILNVVVPPEFKDQVRRHAAFRGLTTSEFVREALSEAMAQADLPVPANKSQSR